MESLAVSGASRNPVTPAPATRSGQPPGLSSSFVFKIMFIAAFALMGVDALLAFPVLSTVLDLSEPATVAVMLAVGLMAAEGATAAGVGIGNGKPRFAAVNLAFVAAVGLALTYARILVGMDGGVQLEGNYAGQLATRSNTEVAAALMMLTLYALSATSIVFASSKIFVQQRFDLWRHDRQRKQAYRKLAPLESEYVAVHERVADRGQQSLRLEKLRRLALEQAAAREEALKDYARDAIARAVGRPDATPLVRAPHEPATETKPLPGQPTASGDDRAEPEVR